MLYYIFVVAFAIPLVIMICAYGRTGIVLYKSVGEARAMMGQTDRYLHRKVKLFHMLSGNKIKCISQVLKFYNRNMPDPFSITGNYVHANNVFFSTKQAKAKAKADDVMNRIQVSV